jgi:dihydroneopterin aldolase
MDTLFIRALRIETVIGIHPWEQHAPQPLLLDIELAFDSKPAAESGSVDDTSDYAAICARLRELLQSRSWRLVETVAERACELLRDEFGAGQVRLSVHKPYAVEDAASVGVAIQRRYVQNGAP